MDKSLSCWCHSEVWREAFRRVNNSLQESIRAPLPTCREISDFCLIVSLSWNVQIRSCGHVRHSHRCCCGTGSTTKQFVKLADEVSVIAARVGKYGFKEKSRVGLKLRLLSRHLESKMSAGTWRINNATGKRVCACVLTLLQLNNNMLWVPCPVWSWDTSLGLLGLRLDWSIESNYTFGLCPWKPHVHTGNNLGLSVSIRTFHFYMWTGVWFNPMAAVTCWTVSLCHCFI